MIGGDAYRLGDVLTASNGKTVEIHNTDAEGRLALADALVYAGELQPTYLFDFATLTGACIVALGPRCAGVMSSDDELVNAVDRRERARRRGDVAPAAARGAQGAAQEPDRRHAQHRRTLRRCDHAPACSSRSSRLASRWVHVDIAGPAMVRKPFGVCDEGGSGFRGGDDPRVPRARLIVGCPSGHPLKKIETSKPRRASCPWGPFARRRVSVERGSDLHFRTGRSSPRLRRAGRPRVLSPTSRVRSVRTRNSPLVASPALPPREASPSPLAASHLCLRAGADEVARGSFAASLALSPRDGEGLPKGPLLAFGRGPVSGDMLFRAG